MQCQMVEPEAWYTRKPICVGFQTIFMKMINLKIAILQKKFLIQKHVMQSQLVEEPGAWQPRKPIKIFENEKFQESDPSKKFLTQKHTLQPQLVEEGQAGSLENPSGDRSRFQTVASPAASQTPGQRQDKKTGRGQNMKKTERQKRQKDKKVTRIAIIKFFHTTAHHHKSIQISEEKEYCA